MKYGNELARAGVALLLASSLWLVVGAEQTTAAWVPVSVSLTLDTAVTLVDAPTAVSAFVVGRRRDLFKLISSPPVIQRAVTEDQRDSVRIELRVQDIDMPAGTDISVRDLRPRLLTFRLRRNNGEPMARDILLPRRTDSADIAVQVDSVLDSLAHARIRADSGAAIGRRDTVRHLSK